jgi:hypothetical protein
LFYSLDAATKNGREQRELLFALLLTCLFLCYAGFAVYHHEMWRDEMGPWLIARDSATLLDIFHNIRYDGHPALWYLLLWPLTRLSADPQAMQWLNLSIAAGAVFLLARFAPAPRWLRACCALGYFPVFEYGSIARNYSLGLVALCAFCALFPVRRERPLLVGLTLLLAANSSMLACILAIALFLVLAVEPLVARASSPRRPRELAGLALAAAGILFSVYRVIPPADTGYAMGWHLGFEADRLVEVLRHLTAAYLPLPVPGPGFWETELLARLFPAWRALSWLAAPLLLCLAALALVRRPLALAYYLAGSLGLVAFFYLKHVGYLRHHGFLVLCLASALWLAGHLEPVRLPGALDALARRMERVGGWLLPPLVAVQLAAGAFAVAAESRYSFSAGQETAALIRQAGLEKLPLVADLDVTGMTVVGYLNKPAAFYPCGDRWGSYVIWDTGRMQHTIIWEQAPVLAAKTGSRLVLLADDYVMKQFPPPAELLPRLQLIGVRRAGIATEESYTVYLFDPATTAATGKRP